MISLVYIMDLVVVAGLVVIVATKGVEWALPFYCFFMVLVPMESKLALGDFFYLTTQRVALITLAGLYLISRNQQSSAWSTHTTPLRNLMFLYILWTIVSTINSVVPELSVKKLVSQVLEYFLFYYILIRTVTHVRTIHKILFALVAGIVVACVFGYVEAYYSWSVLEWFPEATYRFGSSTDVGTAISLGRGVRVRSTYPHAILFGAAIAMAAPLALYLISVTKSRAQRAFLWLGLMLMFLNIYKTLSRGPWLAMILSLSLLFLFGNIRIRRNVGVVCLLAVSVLVVRPGVWMTLQNIYRGSLNTNSQLGRSYEYRYALLDVATEALATNFERQLWGFGMESFFYLGLKGELVGKPYEFLSSDSAWVELMVETGYVGVLILAILLGQALFVSWRNFRRLPGPENHLSGVLFSSIAAYCFMMTNVGLYSWGQNGLMLWTLIALSFAYGRIVTRKRAEEVVQAPVVA